MSSVSICVTPTGFSERKAFFCQRFADSKCEGLKQVESEFLLFLKGINTLGHSGLDPEPIAVNGEVSINFRGLWIRLASPIYSGICSMNINHGGSVHRL